MDQHVALEEVSSGDPVQRQPSQHCRVDRDVAVDGIEYMPVSGSEFCQEGQPEAAGEADRRHVGQPAFPKEPVALRVRVSIDHNRIQQGGKQSGVHLAIAIHLHDDVRSPLHRQLEPGHDGSTHTLVHRVLHQL